MLSPYSVPSIIASVVLIALIVVVIREDRDSRSHQVTAILLSILLLWSVMDAIHRSCSNESVAAYAMATIFAAIIFIPPVILHLSYVFPWKKRGVHPAIMFIYGLSFIILAIHINSDALISGLMRFESGYSPIPGRYAAPFLIYVISAVFISISMLVIRYPEMKGKRIVNRMRFLILGLSIMAILTVSTAALPILLGEQGRYPLTTLSFSLGAIVMIYGFTRPFPDIPEAKSITEGDGDFPSGVRILPKDRAYVLFNQLISRGMAGVCISGRVEGDVRDELDMKDIPVVSSEQLLDGMDGSDAGEALYFMVSDAAMDPGNVVLLDSVETLAGSAGIDRLLKDLKALNLKGMVIVAA